ncbi:hypothetical protein [Hyalangium rubrum]|uniref:Uncharacterized protein n=1 Tax=Hyalangium rubrum TaxID=3103134 RepID=A0ABU5H610_9BACT|nr:hypothetical protein [Hyalangium sp. s54d21]MDY7228917.1 hypothetical protein [Hyalangium sp. s54d21]
MATVDEISQRFEEFAKTLGLGPPGPSGARGRLFGTDVRLELNARREFVTRARIPGPLVTGLQIESEQAVGASGRFAGFRDIQVGVPAFDTCVHVRALNPAAAIRLLKDEALLRHLPAFLTTHPRARLAGDELIVPLPPSLTGDQLQGVVKETAELAVEFGRAGTEESERGQRPRSLELPSQPPAPERQERAAGTGRTPGERFSRQESGIAFTNRVHKSFRRRMWITLGMRLGTIPAAIVGFILFEHWEWTEFFVIAGAGLIGGLSCAVWRCPACDASLDLDPDIRRKARSLRSCPKCFIALERG